MEKIIRAVQESKREKAKYTKTDDLPHQIIPNAILNEAVQTGNDGTNVEYVLLPLIKIITYHLALIFCVRK